MSKIDTWLKELEEYRHAVNGEALHNWPGYFDIGKAVFFTANAMFASGLLYKVLDKDDIAALQKLFTDTGFEQYMNNQLLQNKQNLMNCRAQNRMNDWVQTHKPEAVRQVDFWQKSFCDHRMKLKEIIDKL